MKVADIFSLLGGLALFLYGMQMMSSGLEAAAGNRMKQILEKLTSNRFLGVLVGAVITAVIQSSSATTVMVVGFVNSRMMTLTQAAWIIMGANIGTTVTGLLIALDVGALAPLIAFAGVVLIVFFKNPKFHPVGRIMAGLGVLFIGMDIMSTAMTPLRDSQAFINLMTRFSNPLLGILAGAVFTAIIQSSSASVGILQTLANSGLISLPSAVYVLFGQNIGTCVTALLSSIGAKKNAKRAAFVHLYFNLIGTIVFLVLFYTINLFVNFAFLDDAATPAGIAVVHTAFNVFATCLWLPFHRVLVKLAKLTVRDREENGKKDDAEKQELLGLDERFLDTPAFAVEQCRKAAARMADLTAGSLEEAISLLDRYKTEGVREVSHKEEQVDRYEDRLGTYLVQVSKHELTRKDSHTLSVLLHSIGDMERISDHAVSIAKAAEEIYEKNLAFSQAAVRELQVFSAAIKEIVELTMEAVHTENLEKAQQVEPLEEVIDDLSASMKQRHIERLREGRCTIELGFILSDLTTSYQRIADHCSNIAVCLVQADKDEYGRHAYLKSLKTEDRMHFAQQYQAYSEKYALPERIKGTPKVDMRSHMQREELPE